MARDDGSRTRTESPQESPGIPREKKSNPAMQFVTNAFLKPAGKFFDGMLRVVENAGLTNQVQYPFYLSQDTFWYSVAHALFDFDIHGSENVYPDGTPAVVCFNHQSLFDPIISCVTFAHYTRRRIHMMGKQEMFDVHVISSYVRWCYAFPVKRGEHDMDAYNKALEFLRQGELVGIYPEGTTNGGGYNFLEPHVGAARLAIDGKVPIIPVGISGTDRILPKGAKMPNFNAKLTVKIGKPIRVHEQFFGQSNVAPEELKKIVVHVMDTIKGLLVY
ncbi:MAG: 1-acyl-sn-glycerol-3-phosphate acyltransferase [Candidatus Lokiarchaeota archaeon]|nr:1-acyl-sn-glycerol-3-phosphate acyltransferase [Candidatus Lokiarchaeota archaeon]